MQDLHGWSVMYLRYLRAFQRLNAASSHIIQAQKRKDLRRCLEGCMARMLEIRAHLVSCLPCMPMPSTLIAPC